MSDDYSPYDVRAASGGGYIATYNGTELGTAPTVRATALLCADDAIDAYLAERSDGGGVTPDILYDVVAECGQILANVAHMSWYRKSLADAIEGEFTLEEDES